MSMSAQNKQSCTPPMHFLCPISLEIMKDPVTLCTGQTYERANIQRWLSSGHKTCPITMLKLINCDLIPNHTLRRLIQEYHLTSSSFGLRKTGPPAVEMQEEGLRKLVQEMENKDSTLGCIKTLCGLAQQSVNDRCLIADAGAARILIFLLQKDHQMGTESDQRCDLLQDVVSLLSFVPLVDEERRAIAEPRALERVLGFLHNGHRHAKLHAVRLLRKIAFLEDVMKALGKADGVLSGLLMIIRHESASKQAQKSALKALFQICLPHCNRVKCVQSGAIPTILDILPAARKKNTERALSLISLLCICDEGRQALVNHPTSFAILLRTLHISTKATEAAIATLWSAVSFNADAAALQFLSLQRDHALGDTIISKLVLILYGDYSHNAKSCAINMLKTVRGSCTCIPSAISGLEVLDLPHRSSSLSAKR